MHRARRNFPLKVIANFPLKAVEEEFGRDGIYLLESFPDGQTRWGTEPLKDNGGEYKGSFTMASEYQAGRYDIFQVRAVMERLGKSATQIEELEQRLWPRINEGVQFKEAPIEPAEPAVREEKNGEAKSPGAGKA
jgi:hypothetical protein